MSDEPKSHGKAPGPRAILTNLEVLQNPHEDKDGPAPEKIEADEDLLAELEDDADVWFAQTGLWVAL
ncbi:uncharacterized protein GIQ15_06032 [Arthroderma uncinatum]|uniref:uncharacterized protein n=1 Tax=Arthroderma uncinatum TaxID=74035 RepID=UPI00144A94BC|nr:uncharacterized protein GIQ15_06032 [Arthroderma uncinatum]KAF3480685.1 hypothetical protein GIQ15_06032 [Arthroderma uncinatum]